MGGKRWTFVGFENNNIWDIYYMSFSSSPYCGYAFVLSETNEFFKVIKKQCHTSIDDDFNTVGYMHQWHFCNWVINIFNTSDSFL